ncbi:unnamed protein product [Linum trigynum]|uniref:Uncharacterized protein n=1 Tax=Linum trigynum TaxID=586398 RepID=A0AAV2DH85_9ROSI
MALLATRLKALYFSLAFSFGAILIWTLYTDGNPARLEIYKPWLRAAVAALEINCFTFSLWIIYKESSYAVSAIWIFILFWTAGMGISIYIFIQLLKLSPEECAEDPIYHVLLRHEHKRCEEQKATGKRCGLVVAATRIAYPILGCLLIATIVYAAMTDGSPLRKQIYQALWLKTTMVDIYVNIVALLVWVVYKETSWLSASLWILVFVCFSSFATCAYMIKELYHLSSQGPMYLVLLRQNNNRPHSASRLPLLG